MAAILSQPQCVNSYSPLRTVAFEIRAAASSSGGTANNSAAENGNHRNKFRRFSIFHFIKTFIEAPCSTSTSANVLLNIYVGWEKGCSPFYPPQGWINIKMLWYQYKNSHHKDKTVSRLSHLYNGNPYTAKTHCGLVTPDGDRDLGQHWLR